LTLDVDSSDAQADLEDADAMVTKLNKFNSRIELTGGPAYDMAKQGMIMVKQTVGYDWTWASKRCVCKKWDDTSGYESFKDYGSSCIETDGTGPWCYCDTEIFKKVRNDGIVVDDGKVGVQKEVSYGTNAQPSNSAIWHRCTPECNFPNTYMSKNTLNHGNCISPYWSNSVFSYQDYSSSEYSEPQHNPLQPSKGYDSHSFYIKRPSVLVQDKGTSTRKSYNDVVLWFKKKTNCQWNGETNARECTIESDVRCVRCPDFSTQDDESYFREDPIHKIYYPEPVNGNYTDADATHVPYRVKGDKGAAEAARSAKTEWRQVVSGEGVGQYTAAFLSCVGYANFEEPRACCDTSKCDTTSFESCNSAQKAEDKWRMQSAYPTTEPLNNDPSVAPPRGSFGNGYMCDLGQDAVLNSFVQAEIAQA